MDLSIVMSLGIVFGILNLRNFQVMRKREAAIPTYITHKNWKARPK